MQEEGFFELVSSLVVLPGTPSAKEIKERLHAAGAKTEPSLIDDISSLVAATRTFNAAKWGSVGQRADQWARLTGATKLLFERYFVGGTSDEDWQGFRLVIGSNREAAPNK
jgi:hypothetical protein